MESSPSNQPPETTLLPSSLRIMQRLGQISTNASLQSNFFPEIARHEYEVLTHSEFVGMLYDHMSDYAERHTLGIVGLLFNKMPSYITVLLDDDADKEKALEVWLSEVEKSKQQVIDKERLIKEIMADDLPRRLKKQPPRRQQPTRKARPHTSFYKPNKRRR